MAAPDEHDEPGELEVTALAAGGDGVARDAAGRVVFVPRAAPGDRLRPRIVHATSSYARAAPVSAGELVAAGAARVAPPCRHFAAGCGGCQWQHVAAAEQLAAKQAIVAGALRKLAGLRLHPIGAPSPPLGWRRRARFHVAGGRAGLYELGGARVVPIDHCPQLEPALDAAYAVVAAATPPDGELALLAAHDGRIVVATERAWRGAARLIESPGSAGARSDAQRRGEVIESPGSAGARSDAQRRGAVIARPGIVGVLAGGEPHGEVVVEIEPGLWGGPWDFAQASGAGNAALIAQVRAAVGPGPGRLLELYAGGGNFTRGLVADGWDVVATDGVAPRRPAAAPAAFRAGPVHEVLAQLAAAPSGQPWDALVLDPPRTGAAEAVDGILRAQPRVIVYVSCDAATLGRDAARLTGYDATDAWPFDVMPQTAHVEIVMRLARR